MHYSFNNDINYGTICDVIGSLMPKKYNERINNGFESDHWREFFHKAFEIHYGFPVYFEEISTQKCKLVILLDQVSLKYFNDIVESIFNNGIYSNLKSFSEEIYVNNILISDEGGTITLVF